MSKGKWFNEKHWVDLYHYRVVVYTHCQHTFQFKQLVKVHVASNDPFNAIRKHVETLRPNVRDRNKRAETRTWPCAVLHCFGVWGLRGRSGLGPLVRAHAVAVLAESRAALAGFLISQVQRRALLNGPVARADGGVDFKVGLSLVLLQLSVVGVCDAAFVQTLFVLAHPRDLQLVGDVIALDLDCLWRQILRWSRCCWPTDKAFIC